MNKHKKVNLYRTHIADGLLFCTVSAVIYGLRGLNPTKVENKNRYLEIKTSKTSGIVIASDNKTLKI